MLLRSLKLNNFRQYKDEQLITFSNDKTKNVTVILGDNTSGKTTLVQAFNWTLFDSAAFTTKDFLLNMEVAQDLRLNETANVVTEICLTHDNIDYIITRTQVYLRTSKEVTFNQSRVKVSYKQPDGQLKEIIPTDSTIRKILPPELSGYFFFDGERIGSISSKNDVTESVKGLLGLSELFNAMKHLKSAIKLFEMNMDIKGNRNAELAFERMNSEIARREILLEKLSNAKNEIIHYELRKEHLQEVLRDNQSTKLYQKKKEELEENIKRETKALEDTCKRLISEFNTNAIGFFSQPLIKRASEFLKSIDVADKGVPNMNASSINFLIQRGHCICGAKIEDGSEVHAHLMKESDYLPPQSIGTSIRLFREQMKMYQKGSENYHGNIERKFIDICAYRDRIQNWEDDVEEISIKIKGKDNFAKYENELSDVKVRLRRFYDESESISRDEGACANEIEKAHKSYNSFVSATSKNIEIMNYIMYAQKTYEWINVTYIAKEKEIKEKLENKVNEIFSKMYHGNRKVVIDDKYRVTLLTSYADEDIQTDESRGLETVKNFAFIAGLVDLARKKIIGNIGDGDSIVNLSSEPYPLVMDAPFSNADEKHVGNISKILPEIAEQVIMVVMAKDWAYAKNVMGERVGKQYMLNKESETRTYIAEVAIND